MPEEIDSKPTQHDLMQKALKLKAPVANAIAHPIDVAAAAIGVSVGEIYNLMRRRQITGRKSGKRTVIEDEELRRYIKSLPEWRPSEADAA
jgi:hypothetical protein